MGNRLLLGLLSGLAANASACAESAIHNEGDSSTDSVLADLDAASTLIGLDASTGGDDPSVRAHDAATDARSDAAAFDARALVPDAGTFDGAAEAAVPEAAVGDASTSTSAPDAALVDAGASDAASAPSCAAELSQCGDQCIDTSSDRSHCGSCNRACEADGSCVTGVCLPPAPSGCSAQPFDSHAYLLCTDTRSWRDARAACLDAGMDLVVVDSSSENDFVRANGQSWIGASDQDNEGTWVAPELGNSRRTDGADIGYTNWAAGEPNNSDRCSGVSIGNLCLGRHSDEDCAAVQVDGTWNDADCDNRNAYVCEAY